MGNVARLVANDVNAVVVMPVDYEADGVTLADCEQDPRLTLCGRDESPVDSLSKVLNAGDLVATAVCAARLGDEAAAELGEQLKRRGLQLVSTERGLLVQANQAR